MQKSILWTGLSNDTEEHCAVSFLGDSITVRSEIEGWAEGKPVYSEYIIKLDTHWNVIEFSIKFSISDVENAYSMTCSAVGEWTDSYGNSHPGFNGCRYIDISLTPFTNTLPINGLLLKEKETKEVSVVYIDIMNNRVYRDIQHYTKTTGNRYLFANDGGNFTAEIEVDEDGFVTNYPELFIMNKPQ